MRMKALIDDLLELERLGAKSFPVDIQPVESRDLLEEARTDAQPLADAKHISLVLDLIDPPKIHADPHRISQVLSNLLGNSIKFTPEGGTVTLRARSRDGVLSVTIRIRDAGSLPNIWRTFRSLLATQGIGRRGNGPRALIVRGIVEAHGGRVWAESSPQGATFVFTLPVEPPATEPLTLA